ncbi:MAG: DUF6036 family nucleotidyltransferase [Candidatus Firestonebacteria bacterium]
MKNTYYSGDYLKFLKILDKHKVDYLIIGGYATMLYTKIPRGTKDMDTWIRQTEKNAKNISEAIKEFAGKEIPIEILLKENQRIEIKSETFKIEIWTSQEIIKFEQAWDEKKTEKLGEITLKVISKNHLIKLKKHFNRPQDRLDLSLLEEE